MSSNLWRLIEPSLLKHAGKNAWICRQRKGRRVVRYADILSAALTNAHALRDAGISPGDTVGITAPNGPEWDRRRAGSLADRRHGSASSHRQQRT